MSGARINAQKGHRRNKRPKAQEGKCGPRRRPGSKLEPWRRGALPPALPVHGSSPKNEMGETPFAHASPVYIEFEGRTIFRRDAAETLVADRESGWRKFRLEPC